MRFLLFSIRDTKANCFLAPFVARSEIDAMRQISASFKNPQIADTPIGQNPQDFDLHAVAFFEDESGAVTPTVPVLITPISALVPTSTVPS